MVNNNTLHLVFLGILHELIGFELMQSGLNLSHSQDRYFIKHLVESAGVILDHRYKSEWKRLTELTQRGPNDLVDAFNKYMTVLARSQHDTYTNPFEIVHTNMALGLDIVTAESLFGYEPQQLTEYYKSRQSKPNQYTTESVVLPDTSSFLQHSAKQKPMISFPKYNNYIQDKHKFDRNTKVLVPLEMLGITPPDKNEVTSFMSEYRAIVSYAQYKDVGLLFSDAYDETITRRYGVDIKIATPILSLAILVPSTEETPPKNRNYANDSELEKMINQEDMHSFPTDQVMSIENSISKANEDIKIIVHDLDKEKELEGSPEIKVQFDEGEKEEIEEIKKESSTPFEENEATYTGDKRLVKRQTEDITGAHNAKPIVYRSLGSPHLSQSIKIQMWINIERNRFGPRSNPQCVRWNAFSNSWTRLGCQTLPPDYNALANDLNGPILVNCSCSHISNYAVLVDVIDPEYIPEPSLLIQITSYSAFLISLPILVCVLIALALLRGMQTNSNTIHQNLVMCVFCAELLFFIGMQSRRNLVENEFPCKMIAICLHYSWLAAFAWTTVDCIHLYRMLTEMRDINHGPMGFYFSLGYGAPAVVVGLSVGVRAHEYGNSLL